MNGFSVVWSERALLLSGLANTIVLTVVASLGAFALGTVLCTALISRHSALRLPIRGLVDLMRCTPFLLLAYLVYYGLPVLGVRPSAWQAGLWALVVYHAAYVAEILRGAWAVLPREPLEAGHAFGFTGRRLFTRIVLPPMLLASGPVLGNQSVQIIKDTAFLTIITLPELTHAASSIQSRHYVPFAAFVVAVGLYWLLCLVVEVGVARLRASAGARR